MNGVLMRADGERFDLEDAVSGVHFLLTGVASGGQGPLSFLLGECAAFSASEVADAVESIAARAVHARLASAELSAVVPFVGRALADDDKEWLLAVLQGVMAFMRRAASEGVAVQVELGADG